MSDVEFGTYRYRPKESATSLHMLSLEPHTPSRCAWSKEFTPRLKIMRYSRKVYNEELLKVLSPEYVEFAFALPDDSGSIWSVLVSDIESVASRMEVDTPDAASLLNFLRLFFSQEILEVVAENFKALAESNLGLQYTFMRAKASIGKSVVDGIREQAAEFNTPLAYFLGQVSEADELEDQEDDTWQIVCRRKSKRLDRVAPSGGSNSRDGATAGAGDGSASGSGGGGGSTGEGSGTNGGDQGAANSGSSGAGGFRNDAYGSGHFLSMEEKTIEVLLPAFVTPPKGDKEKKLKVRDRALLFKEKVNRWCGRLYRPHSEQAPGYVSIFHGTRTSSLQSFKVDGICPDGDRSEFSRMPAFYASNSVLHAFERPLHHKVGRCVGDLVSVLEFRVDVSVLHGESAPPGESTAFDIRWFRGPYEEWKCFCIGNMAFKPELRALAPVHAHDIVIGPVCIPLNGGIDMGVESYRLGSGDVFVCQIAFCTPRSWSWLEGCFQRVYQEKRDL